MSGSPFRDRFNAQAERVRKLEQLRDAVILACGDGPWTAERQAKWEEVTGEKTASYAYLGKMAEAIGA